MFGIEFDDTDGSVVLEIVKCVYISWLDGVTGSHVALKILWTNVRAGSIPAPTTKKTL